MNNISASATNTNVPYFRRLTDDELDRFDACVKEFTWIAEIKNVICDNNEFDIEIVINQFDGKDSQANMAFYFYSKNKKASGDFGMVWTMHPKNSTVRLAKKIAREMMQVNKLSVVTFEANRFDMFYM